MSIKIYGWVPMIRMSDMRYPVYLSDFKAEYTNVSTGSFVYEEGMAEFGYYPVIDVDIPQGDVVTEGAPVQGEDGKWYKSWNSRDYTEEEIADNLRRQKEQLIYSAKSNFENENMGGVEVDGSFYSVDSNSLSLYHSILSVAELAEDDKLFSLLTYDNKVIEHLRLDVIELIEEIISVYVESYNNMGTFIKEVNIAKNMEELPSVPESFRTV